MKNICCAFFLIISIIVCSFPLYAQKSENPPILIFEKDTVYKSEFERVYQKNNGGYEAAKQHSKEQYREYLDLYINFKRKVFEAEAQGLHETEAFKREFETYRKQLVQPYLSATDVEEKLIEEAYERSGYLVNASHLLLKVAEDALPEDTLKTYQHMMAIRDSILSGKYSFEEMAQKYSEDPSVKQNDGVLGYFSAFDMVYPFETAAFQTPLGEVSEPVRTVFGYHLLKVNDKLDKAGEKRASHVIIRVGDRYSAKDSTQALDLIKEIHQKLKEGADFAEMARQYSDDPGTANKGGELGTTRLLPAMEQQKIKLAEGEFSDPFITPYGWHILKVTEVIRRPSFEESKSSIQQRISRDSRSKLGREALLNRIKSENGFEYNSTTFEQFVSQIDAAFSRGTWRPDSTQEALYNQPLFSVSGKSPVLLQEMVDYYQQNRLRYPRLGPERAAEVVKDNFIRQWLLDYEEQQLPQKNPEFGYLLKEYRDGILLFSLMEEKVWKKAVEDTTGLLEYYQNHQEEFYSNESVDVVEYRCTSDTIIQKVKQLIKAGNTETQIDSIINQNSALNVRIITVNYEKGESDLDAKLFDQPVGYTTAVQQENDTYLIRVLKEKFDAGTKSFEKSKSECITKYQDYLENEWLDELAQKYPVEINQAAFGNLFQ